MSIREVTVSTQIRSANTTSEIENHSGKKNRGSIRHENEDIDTSRSHLNVEFDMYDKYDLLEQHYRERIDKHNKNNNSAARRYDSMDEFLQSFEGKKVKVGGKISKNERWSTASQISYFGGKDSLEDVLGELAEVGMPLEELIEAYTEGYREYIEKHNEKFPTLPIYHSDLHFDETTPHSHDAIVVMGHTKTGRPSDSIDNALGELYGYAPNFKGKAKNMSKYREDNDKIMFDSVAPKLEELGEQYGVPIDFEFIRTGQEGSEDYKTYKKNKDNAKREALINKRSKTNNKNKAWLDRKKTEIDSKESAQWAKDELQKEKEKKLNERERSLDNREELINKRIDEMQKKDDDLSEREKTVETLEGVIIDTTITVLEGRKDLSKFVDNLRKNGIKTLKNVDPQQLRTTMTKTLVNANSGRLKIKNPMNIHNNTVQREHDLDGPGR